jgi:enolase-phosphatase E1
LIDLESYGAILLDIEGTTTPVRFVYDVLFPYSRARFAGFLRAHGQDVQVQEEIAGLRAEHARDESAGRNPPRWPGDDLESAAEYARWLLDHDRKVTPLKSLQGRIWEEGFASGALRGQVYPDVPPAFERWTRAGKTLAIFSSGSVLAQRLLFTHSEAGNLERFLSAHFDTTTGPKTEESSYERIAEVQGRAPSEIVFLSDVTAELDAARRGGMGTALVVRESAPPPAGHPVVRDFSLSCFVVGDR